MQTFHINQNSLLPTLRMDLIDDGRHDFLKFYEAIQDADITFSMVNVDNGNIKVSKAPAYIKRRERESCAEEYCICYDWKERDTREKGVFKGTFEITFKGNITSPGKTYPTGRLIMPIMEDLLISIN